MRKLLAFFLFSLVLTSLSFAQENIEPELAEQLDNLKSATETIRQLPALDDVDLFFPSRSDLEVFLGEMYSEYYTPEVLEQELGFYQSFGFLPSDYDFLANLQALYGEQIAGFYDSEAETMNVIITGGREVSRFLPLLDQIIFVHEYDHALQDQHFDLDSFLGDSSSDTYLAHLALVEGDASLVMSFYTTAVAEANPLLTLMQLGIGILQAGNISIPEGTPAIIEAELTFPYLAGLDFVTALHNEGGWEFVNQAYEENPPLSTEHILHPEIYLAGVEPLQVSLDLDENLAILKSGVFGEFYLRQWLEAQGLERQSVNLAATGWAGDAYAVYRDEDGAIAFVLDVYFDDEAEQAEFLSLLLEAINLELDADKTACWQGEYAAFCIANQGGYLSIWSN